MKFGKVLTLLRKEFNLSLSDLSKITKIRDIHCLKLMSGFEVSVTEHQAQRLLALYCLHKDIVNLGFKFGGCLDTLKEDRINTEKALHEILAHNMME